MTRMFTLHLPYELWNDIAYIDNVDLQLNKYKRYKDNGDKVLVAHNDVIKWKYFPRYWPYVRESTNHQWILLKRPVTGNVGVLLDLCLNKRWSKQSVRQWFEKPSRSLWHHCKVSTWGTDTWRTILLTHVCKSYVGTKYDSGIMRLWSLIHMEIAVMLDVWYQIYASGYLAHHRAKSLFQKAY